VEWGWKLGFGGERDMREGERELWNALVVYERH